ncbi:MAG TPA: tetratricopeptide repeat protein, partial [Thermoanaerobaculia bacterium]|nr:tetratricopeptide repeat protein [Thermoanaerobaculia bacterium]
MRRSHVSRREPSECSRALRSAAGAAFAAALSLLPALAAPASEPADLGPAFRLAEELLTRGEYDRALQAAREALDAARRAHDTKGEAWALDLEGDALFYRGELPAALRSFQRARSLFHSLGHRSGEATALKDVGITQRDLGLFEESLVTLLQAREAFRATGDRRGEGSALENLGGVYAALGLPRRALEAYREVLPMAEAERDPELHAGILIRMGNLAADRDRALGLYIAALGFAKESGRPAARGWALLCLAGTLEGLGRADEAAAARESARALYRKMGSRGDEAIVLKDTAYAEMKADPAGAARTFETAISLVRDEEPRVRAALFHGLGVARHRAGDFSGAVSALETALAEIDSIRGRLERGEHRAAFSSQYQGVTHELMQTFLQRREDGDEARAFAVVERWRARDTRESLRSFRKGLEARGESDLPTLRSLQSLLGPRGALVSYVLARDGVFAFLVTGEAFEVVRLAVATDVLDARVATLVDLLSRGDPGERGVADRVGAEILVPLLSR